MSGKLPLIFLLLFKFQLQRINGAMDVIARAISYLSQSGNTLVASLFHLDFKFSILVPDAFDVHGNLNVFTVRIHFKVGCNALVRIALVVVHDKRVLVEIDIFTIYGQVTGSSGRSSISVLNLICP